MFRLYLIRCLTLLSLCFAFANANAQSDPPARVAALSHMEGTVAFAPLGETEWADAMLNRPITGGDRVWTDPGARAEVHLGSAALHMASKTFVEVVELDEDVLRLTLNEGSVNARVRQLEGGENFEIATPQLAMRATQPGEYRIDVDPAAGYTRVSVRSGVAMIYGAGAGVMQLRTGQQMAFTGRDLAAVAVPAPMEDAFDRWAAERNRAEDQSIAARYVPREVVGYQALDANGVWAQEPDYGPVWYPAITVADWAPYRYGRWEWIVPWGWTWIDDARWGFAPFHYGRWAHIRSRWAWVPGRIDRHPVYSPALVAFVGGSGANWNLSIGSGPGIGWFPLAPGEAWRPAYRASTAYLRNANRNAVFSNGGFAFQNRPDAITTVRLEDFRRGVPVHQHWNRVGAGDAARLQLNRQPVLPQPQPRRLAEGAGIRSAQPRPQPQMQFVAPVAPSMAQQQQRLPQRTQGEQRPRAPAQPALQAQQRTQQLQQQQRERQAQHAQQVQQAQPMQRDRHAQQAQQVQQLQQVQRQRQEQQREIVRERQAARQQERTVRQQQAVQQQRAQEHVQQRAPRAQERAQQRAAPPQRQLPAQAAAPAQQRSHGRQGVERSAQGGDDEGNRGRGRGRF